MLCLMEPITPIHLNFENLISWTMCNVTNVNPVVFTASAPCKFAILNVIL